MTWNDESFQHFADDLATAASLDIARGFPEGSHTGQTRAKPEIWENKTDFDSKIGDLKEATMALKIAAVTGDKGKIMEAFKATGGACKACHDDYKSKNYLN
jgi:cytochrome c556